MKAAALTLVCSIAMIFAWTALSDDSGPDGLSRMETIGRMLDPTSKAGTHGFGDMREGYKEDLFAKAKETFEEEEGVADGLGPVFNDVSCAACHNQPAIGGGDPSRLSINIGRRLSDGRFDPLIRLGGPIIQSQGIGPVTINGETHFFDAEFVPKEATVVSRRRATPIFGLGLVDEVPDSTFWFIAKAQRQLSPRTAGRPNVVIDVRTGKQSVGRFGWGAQAHDLFHFAADAYVQEMGITIGGLAAGDLDKELCPQGDCDALRFNPLPSPNDAETDDIEAFVAFMAGLAPPPRGPITKQTLHGREIFRKIGCSACHLPTLRTAKGEEFHPYSDFLLHDMGKLGDGIEKQGVKKGSEMRTAPLWGLRMNKDRLLHDGSAYSITEAIKKHAGQGSDARDKFSRLSSADREALMAFLGSL